MLFKVENEFCNKFPNTKRENFRFLIKKPSHLQVSLVIFTILLQSCSYKSQTVEEMGEKIQKKASAGAALVRFVEGKWEWHGKAREINSGTEKNNPPAQFKFRYPDGSVTINSGFSLYELTINKLRKTLYLCNLLIVSSYHENHQLTMTEPS